MHVVPRISGDLEGDAVHELLERWTWNTVRTPKVPTLEWPADELRKNRKHSIMAQEAKDLREIIKTLPSVSSDCDTSWRTFSFASINISSDQIFFQSKSGLSSSVPSPGLGTAMSSSGLAPAQS